VINLRTVHAVSSATQVDTDEFAWERRDARLGERRILLPQSKEPAAATIYDRVAMAPGLVFAGPAIVEQIDTTTLIAPGWTGRVADNGALILVR
jgi:N-methylhydantoinase A